MIPPSQEAVDADARLRHRQVTGIHKGACADGTPWCFITLDGFAEFRCGNLYVDFIYPEQRDQIAAMLPFVESSGVKKLITDIRGWRRQ